MKDGECPSPCPPFTSKNHALSGKLSSLEITLAESLNMCKSLSEVMLAGIGYYKLIYLKRNLIIKRGLLYCYPHLNEFTTR